MKEGGWKTGGKNEEDCKGEKEGGVEMDGDRENGRTGREREREREECSQTLLTPSLTETALFP